MTIDTLAVFCGSSLGSNPAYSDAANRLGHALAHRGITLVYGGGEDGLMGIIANAVLSGGGSVRGIVPRLPQPPRLSDALASSTIFVNDLHERKAMMSRLADAFLALPGGSGTLEELTEQWTWAQVGVHQKPVGIVNVAGYYDPLLGQLENMRAFGFTRPRNFSSVIVGTEPLDVLDRLQRYDFEPST